MNQIHVEQNTAFTIAAGALAAIIVLTVMDLIPGVDIGAEIAKKVIGIALGIEIAGSVTGIASICSGFSNSVRAVSTASAQDLSFAKPGHHGIPHFEELPRIDWSSAQDPTPRYPHRPLRLLALAAPAPNRHRRGQDPNCYFSPARYIELNKSL